MADIKPVLQVIIGSTRPGRVGAAVAEWIAEQARQDGRFQVELLDLAEVNLPLLDEPNHPRLQNYTKDHTKRWSETISRGDAFIFVVPEYNYGVAPSVANAIDFLFNEWSGKALSIASYGGISGGTRGAQALKVMASAVRLHLTADHVIIPFVAKMIGDDGGFQPTEHVQNAVTPMLDGILELDRVLRPLRG